MRKKTLKRKEKNPHNTCPPPKKFNLKLKKNKKTNNKIINQNNKIPPSPKKQQKTTTNNSTETNQKAHKKATIEIKCIAGYTGIRLNFLYLKRHQWLTDRNWFSNGPRVKQAFTSLSTVYIIGDVVHADWQHSVATAVTRCQYKCQRQCVTSSETSYMQTGSVQWPPWWWGASTNVNASVLLNPVVTVVIVIAVTRTIARQVLRQRVPSQDNYYTDNGLGEWHVSRC